MHHAAGKPENTDHLLGESAVGKVASSLHDSSGAPEADAGTLEFSCSEICQGQLTNSWLFRQCMDIELRNAY